MRALRSAVKTTARRRILEKLLQMTANFSFTRHIHSAMPTAHFTGCRMCKQVEGAREKEAFPNTLSNTFTFHMMQKGDQIRAVRSISKK